MYWYWWVLIVVLVLAVVAGLAWLAVWLVSLRTRQPPEIKQGGFQVWYGLVNAWAMVPKTMDKVVDECAEAGVSGIHIELAGWSRSDMWSDKWIADTSQAYRRLLARCRRRGLWLFVGVANDNMGSRKYGDPGIRMTDVYHQVLKLVHLVRDEGPDNVIVQPVGETQTPAGVKLEQDCILLLPEFPLVYNGGVGRPGNIPAGFKYRAWHPLKVTDEVPSDAIAVSDTGSIILQLGVGLTGPAHPDTLEAWARHIRACGCPVACYYAFLHDQLDKPAIQALGRSKK